MCIIASEQTVIIQANNQFAILQDYLAFLRKIGYILKVSNTDILPTKARDILCFCLVTPFVNAA